MLIRDVTVWIAKTLVAGARSEDWPSLLPIKVGRMAKLAEFLIRLFYLLITYFVTKYSGVQRLVDCLVVWHILIDGADNSFEVIIAFPFSSF